MACKAYSVGLMSATLDVRDLKRALGDRTIITDLGFSVVAGEVLFIRGPSGVGKSLLLRALAYLDPIQVAHAFVRFLDVLLWQPYTYRWFLKTMKTHDSIVIVNLYDVFKLAINSPRRTVRVIFLVSIWHRYLYAI